MKAIIVSVLGVVLGGAVFAADVTPGVKPKGPATRPATQPAKPVNKMCLVDPGETADPAVTYTHKGKVYAFCCEGCVDAFKKNPDKYKDAK